MTAPNSTKGRLFIISAPSGAGKTTLCNAVLNRFKDIEYSISHTTRPPRRGEQEGVDYFFIDKEQFLKDIKENKWVEWAEVHGNFYGTSARFLDEKMDSGLDVLLDIDVQGAKQICKRYPDSVTIFILPPSLAALKNRLERRGSDSKATIAKRIRNAEEEIAQNGFYRHVILNDKLEKATSELIAIISKHKNQ